MAVQRGNVQCVQGAYGESAFEELDEIFYIVKPNTDFFFIWTFKISLHFQFALDQIFKSLLRIDWVLNYKQLQPGTGDD